MTHDLFISYSRKDYEDVIQLKQRLEKDIPQLSVWFDIDGIESGSQFTEKIVTAINNSGSLLFVITPHSMSSVWTRKEVSFAQAKRKRIIPVLLDENTPIDDYFRFEIGITDCITISDHKQYTKLVRDISKWTHKDSTIGKEDYSRIPTKSAEAQADTNHNDLHHVKRQDFSTKSLIWNFVIGVVCVLATTCFFLLNRDEAQEPVVQESPDVEKVEDNTQQESTSETKKKSMPIPTQGTPTKPQSKLGVQAPTLLQPSPPLLQEKKEEASQRRSVAADAKKAEDEEKARERKAREEGIQNAPKRAQDSITALKHDSAKQAKVTDDTIMDAPTQSAEFPGDIYAWLAKNIKYPSICQEQGVQGRVSVSFVINKDGSISDAKVIRAPDEHLAVEALRVVNSMPLWTPARHNGQVVRMRYVLPIMFRTN